MRCRKLKAHLELDTSRHHDGLLGLDKTGGSCVCSLPLGRHRQTVRLQTKMAETLVIEWDRHRLLAAFGSGNKISAATSIDRIDGESEAELGEKLKAALPAAGISAESATVVLPRQVVTFHQATLPNLPESELPELVRMQAATRLTIPVESVCLDFVPMPVEANAESRNVLLVTLPQNQVQRVMETLSAAGLTLDGVHVSSFGIAGVAEKAGLLSKAKTAGTYEALLSMGSDSIELILTSGNEVVFSHSGASWASPDGIERAVRSEVSRARMAAAQDLGDYTISRLTLVGPESATSAVPDSVTARLNQAPIERVDPEGRLIVGGAEGVSATDLLAAAGAMTNQKQKHVPAVDLVNPRKPIEKPDNTRLKVILAVGLSFLALTAAWKWRDSQVKKYAKQTETLKTEVAAMNLSMRDFEKKSEDVHNDLTKFTDRDINWLEEMVKLRAIMGSTEKVFIERFDFNVRGGDTIAGIDVQGYAKSRQAIEDLAVRLRKAGYVVAPTTNKSSQRDPAYTRELTLNITIPGDGKKS